MNRKVLVVLFVIVLVTISLFPGCSGDDKVYHLTFNNHSGPTTSVAQGWDYWAEWVEEESEGRLDVEVVHGGALLSGDEVFRGVKTGVADGGQYILDREDGFLLNLVLTLPFMNLPDEQTSAEIYWQLLDEFPEMQAEWEGIQIQEFGVLIMMPPAHLHTTTAVVSTPADMQGLRIMASEALTAEAVNQSGATAVELGISEMATSLNTGLIDGVINHFAACGSFGGLEFLMCHTVFGDGGINMTPKFAILNQDFFDSLPSDLQQILLDSGPVVVEKQFELQNEYLLECIDDCETRGDTFVYLTTEEIEGWYNLVKQPIHDAWIAECEAAGLPGQAVYDRALELIKEYQ